MFYRLSFVLPVSLYRRVATMVLRQAPLELSPQKLFYNRSMKTEVKSSRQGLVQDGSNLMIQSLDAIVLVVLQSETRLDYVRRKTDNYVDIHSFCGQIAT